MESPPCSLVNDEIATHPQVEWNVDKEGDEKCQPFPYEREYYLPYNKPWIQVYPAPVLFVSSQQNDDYMDLMRLTGAGAMKLWSRCNPMPKVTRKAMKAQKIVTIPKVSLIDVMSFIIQTPIKV
jgi:hypothetical protein